jgi:hypothetical protein
MSAEWEKATVLRRAAAIQHHANIKKLLANRYYVLDGGKAVNQQLTIISLTEFLCINNGGRSF